MPPPEQMQIDTLKKQVQSLEKENDQLTIDTNEMFDEARNMRYFIWLLVDAKGGETRIPIRNIQSSPHCNTIYVESFPDIETGDLLVKAKKGS